MYWNLQCSRFRQGPELVERPRHGPKERANKPRASEKPGGDVVVGLSKGGGQNAGSALELPGGEGRVESLFRAEVGRPVALAVLRVVAGPQGTPGTLAGLPSSGFDAGYCACPSAVGSGAGSGEWSGFQMSLYNFQEPSA